MSAGMHAQQNSQGVFPYIVCNDFVKVYIFDGVCAQVASLASRSEEECNTEIFTIDDWVQCEAICKTRFVFFHDFASSTLIFSCVHAQRFM